MADFDIRNLRKLKTDRKVRVVGEKGSEQNRLRGEIYPLRFLGLTNSLVALLAARFLLLSEAFSSSISGRKI